MFHINWPGAASTTSDIKDPDGNLKFYTRPAERDRYSMSKSGAGEVAIERKVYVIINYTIKNSFTSRHPLLPLQNRCRHRLGEPV